jgi:hypothetical protein
MLPVAVKVQPARDELLSGAALALNQHGAIRVGDLVDQVVDELHFAARADDVFEFVLILEFLSEIGVLLAGRLKLERTLHGHLELVDLERLRHVAVRPHLHRLDRGIDRRVGGD